MEPTMTIDLITLFPGMVEPYFAQSMLGRAIKNGILEVNLRNLRDWADPHHHMTDDRPFGGGAGMVLMPEPLTAAIETLKKPKTKTIYLCPDGEPLTGSIAQELAQETHLILISGHYEGIDERIREDLVDQEISIGDYVLTNGTLPAAVLIDAVARYVPGVLGEEKSLTHDSFRGNLLSFPQYTRPATFRGKSVPEVLISGNHQAIEDWRKEQQIKRTKERRPDLISKYNNNHESTD